MTNIGKADSVLGGKIALQGDAIVRFTELNKTRENLLEMRVLYTDKISKDNSEFTEKLEAVNKEIDSISEEINDLIKYDKIQRDKQIEILSQTHENLLNKRDSLDGKIAESTAKSNEIKDKIAEVNGKALKKNPISKGLKKIGGVGIGTLTNAAKSGVKSGFTKADPFAKSINKDDVADTGSESIRLAKTSLNKVNSGIKTAKNTVKTTNRGIRTVKNTTVNTIKAACLC